ncbi:MAG: DUF1302 domain-containing protein [Gammaproteobacteria bacterium]|nr:DUF1302 domain-containing protein [Gammaproteobacteria bacterium]
MKHRLMRRILAGAALLYCAGSGQAMTFEWDSGLSMDLDTSLTYGAQWRVEDPQNSLLRRPDPAWGLAEKLAFLSDTDTVIAQNMDDGNNNFDTGLVSSRMSVLSDLELNYGDFGVLVRAKAFYDQVYQDRHTDMDAIGYQTYNDRPDTRIGDFPAATEDDHGSDLAILDAYVYGSFDIGERLLDLRLGRQVINWGEATFFPGINGMQNRFDGGAANVPGTEVKEILLPTGAVYGQIDISSSLTLQSYYQYEWKRTRLNGVGSFFSQQDYMGVGAESYYLGALDLVGLDPFVPRLATDDASDQGQWGSALRLSLESGAEIGFYYVRAHNKSPAFELTRIAFAGQELPVSYRIHYVEDIDTYGLSFSTLLGDMQVNGELSLRQGVPMADQAGDPREDDLLQAQIGFTAVFEPSALWDDLTIVGEVVGVQDQGRSNDEVRYDSAAWGYALRADFAYKNVIQAVDLNVPVFLMHTAHGTVRESNMVDDAVVLSVGLRGTYLDTLMAELSYATYFGGGFDNWGIDRDNVALTLKYSF